MHCTCGVADYEIQYAYSPYCVKHGDEREKCSDQENHSARHHVRNHHKTSPRHNDKEWTRQIALQQVTSQFPSHYNVHSSSGVIACDKRSQKYCFCSSCFIYMVILNYCRCFLLQAMETPTVIYSHPAFFMLSTVCVIHQDITYKFHIIYLFYVCS